jgi:hypothetical protein
MLLVIGPAGACGGRRFTGGCEGTGGGGRDTGNGTGTGSMIG